MAIAYTGGASDVAADTSDTALTVTIAVVEGEQVIAVGHCATSRSISTDESGWTEDHDDNTTYRTYIWKRTATAADETRGNFSFTASGTFNSAHVEVHRMTGADLTNAITAGFASGTNSNSQTAPTITTPAANCLVFWGLYYPGDRGPCSADKGTERIDASGSVACVAQYSDPVVSAASTTGAVISSSGFGAKRVYSFAIEPDTGGGAYTLTAAAGSFTLSGQDADVLRGVSLPASAAAFTLTGQSAGTLAGRSVASLSGSFTFTGQDAGLLTDPSLVADAGTFTLSGQAAGLEIGYRLTASPGSIALTGQDAALTYTEIGAYVLPAAVGSFVMLGQDASFVRDIIFVSAAGAFLHSGKAANLLYSAELPTRYYVVAVRIPTLTHSGPSIPNLSHSGPSIDMLGG